MREGEESLECREYLFSKTVPVSDETDLAEYVVAHGKATGHAVEIPRVEEGD